MIKRIALKLNEPCPHCGGAIYKTEYVKPHVGLYCAGCNKWIKWLSKKEKDEYGLIILDDVENKEQPNETFSILQFDEIPFD